MATEATPRQPAGRAEAVHRKAPSIEDIDKWLFPIGHYIGTKLRDGGPSASRQVRVGTTFHDLSPEQFTVWTAAHGTREALELGAVWQRRAVVAQPQVAAVANAAAVIDGLIELGLLAEVAAADDPARVFAVAHRVVPIMLGLGNSPDQPDMFGIGFLHQPIIQVSYLVYDVWQWSSMDDSLWATCENASDVARRSGLTDPDAIDPAKLLDGFLGSLHALLLANAAYLDVGFRLGWPDVSNESIVVTDNG